MFQFEALTEVRPAFATAMAGPGWPRAAQVPELDDVALVRLAAEVEAVGRRVDALRAAVAGEIADRSRRELGPEGLAHRLGCRNGVELLQRVTGAASPNLNRRIRLGEATAPTTGLSGAPLPPRFPAVARALDEGLLGVDAAQVIVDTLSPAIRVAGLAAVDVAEGEIVAGAAALDELNPGLLDADSVRLQARVWHVALDPDGAAPDEQDEARRFLRFSAPRHGLIPVSGMLLPEVAAAFQTYVDACNNPRTSELPGPDGVDVPSQRAGEPAQHADDGAAQPGEPVTDAAAHRGEPVADAAAQPGAVADAAAQPGADAAHASLCDTGNAADHGWGEVLGGAPASTDERTGAQKMHDVFAAMIQAAAKSFDAPSVAGNPPTLVVGVRFEDLERGRGAAYADGVPPISIAAARQIGCAGAIQKVLLGSNGRIIQLEAPQRCFTGTQRRAIALRDGNCVIPNCHVPASWCEIHHVEPRSWEGPTHTDNGVTLCWYHHRTIDRSGWEVRMRDGYPEIKAPAWLDRSQTWRRAIGSPVTIKPVGG